MIEPEMCQRVAPELDARKAGIEAHRVGLRHRQPDVIGEQWQTAPVQRGDEGGLAGARVAAEGIGGAVEGQGAHMQRQQAALMQQRAERGAEQPQAHVALGRVRRGVYQDPLAVLDAVARHVIDQKLIDARGDLHPGVGEARLVQLRPQVSQLPCAVRIRCLRPRLREQLRTRQGRVDVQAVEVIAIGHAGKGFGRSVAGGGRSASSAKVGASI